MLFFPLILGQFGFTIEEETTNGIPAVCPYTGWALFLPKDSPFRYEQWWNAITIPEIFYVKDKINDVLFFIFNSNLKLLDGFKDFLDRKGGSPSWNKMGRSAGHKTGFVFIRIRQRCEHFLWNWLYKLYYSIQKLFSVK